MHAYGNCIATLPRLLSALLPLYNAYQLFGQEEPLTLSLCELLIPDLAAAAVALQLPPERWPPWHSWGDAAGRARVLSVLGLICRSLLTRQLCSGSGPASMLLPTAVQLLQHAPLPGHAAAEQPPVEHFDWNSIASLSGNVTLAVDMQLGALQPEGSGNATPAALQRLAAQAELLLPLIPRFAAS